MQKDTTFVVRSGPLKKGKEFGSELKVRVEGDLEDWKLHVVGKTGGGREVLSLEFIGINEFRLY